MTHPDTALFLLMTAGPSPSSWLLPFACAIAEGGAWLCAALMGWAAWRHPRERSYLLIPEESRSPAVLRRAWMHADRLSQPKPLRIAA